LNQDQYYSTIHRMKPSYSGKFVLRISPELHGKLKVAATRQGLSLNELCQGILESGFRPSVQSGGESLASAIQSEFGESLQGILLFGSAARGEMTAESDVDLLVVVKSAIERSLYRRWDDSEGIALATKSFAHPVNPQFVRLPARPADAGGIWLEAAIDGQILWSRDSRVPRFLVDVRKAIMAGRFQRALSHGHFYWIRKAEAEVE
jgi:hypothetical protein